jgi:ribose transport system substrate-binding protein
MTRRMCRVAATFAAVAALLGAGCSGGRHHPTGGAVPPATSDSHDPAVVEARQAVATASTTGATTWVGPTSGPPAQPAKVVVYVAQTLTNGGVAGAARGVQEAAQKLGWTLRVVDGGGTQAGIQTALSSAINQRPDGIVIGGFDAASVAPQLQAAARAGIKVVGWHAAVMPGPIGSPPVFFNVATDSTQVARLTAQFAIARSDGHAGVVILTDSSIPIAESKAQTMRQTVQSCADCRVLAYVNVPIADATARIPQQVAALLSQFDDTWTETLAINDLYFDAAAPALRTAGRAAGGAPYNSSAGDGSVTAFDRIRRGEYQAATVPEPLYEQGWQLVDELNRAFAGSPPSGYVSAVHLIIGADIGPNDVYDPRNGYREHYSAIWLRRRVVGDAR